MLTVYSVSATDKEGRILQHGSLFAQTKRAAADVT
jgi:hypothetical protein